MQWSYLRTLGTGGYHVIWTFASPAVVSDSLGMYPADGRRRDFSGHCARKKHHRALKVCAFSPGAWKAVDQMPFLPYTKDMEKGEEATR